MSILSRLASYFDQEESQRYPVFVYVDDLDGTVFYVGRRAAYENTRVTLKGSGYISKGRFLA